MSQQTDLLTPQTTRAVAPGSTSSLAKTTSSSPTTHGPTVEQIRRQATSNAALKRNLWWLDLLAAPFVLAATLTLKATRSVSIEWLPISKAIFDWAGVYPIKRHYYEPFIDEPGLGNRLSNVRPLPGIDWNAEEQLRLLQQFRYNDELLRFPIAKTGKREFYYANTAFREADAQFLYNMIRHVQPKKLIEIGSGQSTLMAVNAIKRNRIENPEADCHHICIEPFEQPWLETVGPEIVRERIENVDRSLIEWLDAGDILFIDSTHLLSPQGDVVTEYLELLPLLRPGVIVHIHDIFSPQDYPDDWIKTKRIFWNEQYLLEAFLTHNKSFRIIGALNYLWLNHRDALNATSPLNSDDSQPSSFWIVRSDD